jgi:hypothetical protein
MRIPVALWAGLVATLSGTAVSALRFRLLEPGLGDWVIHSFAQHTGLWSLGRLLGGDWGVCLVLQAALFFAVGLAVSGVRRGSSDTWQLGFWSLSCVFLLQVFLAVPVSW